MADWVVAVGGDRFRGERLYQADAVEVAVPGEAGVLPGDRVVLTAEDAGGGWCSGSGGWAGRCGVGPPRWRTRAGWWTGR